jgi:single-strand DNA-binding protein
MNRWNGVGHLTRDPELVTTEGGTAICNMRIAVDRRGQGRDYFDVKCFEGQARACSEHLAKGRQVAIDGRLRFEEFKTKDDQYASRVYIIGDSVLFLGRPRQANSSDDAEQPSAEPAAASADGHGSS